MYIVEIFTYQIADRLKYRIEERCETLEDAQKTVFLEKLKNTVAGYKIYTELKHENNLIEQKWDRGARKYWAQGEYGTNNSTTANF